MAREFSRTDRISDQIQKDLATLIRTEMKDPRVGMVTINDVNVARDLGFADVYITLLTLEENDANSDSVKQTLKALNSAAGFLRSQLGKMIKLRTIPQLRFHFDSSVGHGRKLDALITKARKKDSTSSSEESDDV
ncbi:ribosome-binding factor A [Oleiphilus sp. HI0071]|uniref:30S ribosome-binding factor RbfA n=1 Tax=Oleiphilus sp. HI0080 TaxID=1822255 RepID=UPI0007C2AEEF|nr:30S ribosome-binding factor RbfA [Oleiphilus sp. HI0080]KZY64730.1 ribosome-binding factor A [Oleiphilus sp. HI0065]KZY81390.1 ribosome-binding factor A [Oleiphilus sp. HI0071]KZZ04920.1 ribosome-binding factor A [Oleiphilus sp. HI0073]KZZ43760.1 ribosome-binding factor A [Oleiphilus sp. HI0118]KZZ56616.1 ribosome-binding factor A [Oleiphilus sp. HI0122]KZZ71791.1 ribosome-binding factor A [Oleiphilus sp. HI0130]KZZ80925.1 ribosome-binding factor A [Oleiphilus sp. HI0133]